MRNANARIKWVTLPENLQIASWVSITHQQQLLWHPLDRKLGIHFAKPSLNSRSIAMYRVTSILLPSKAQQKINKAMLWHFSPDSRREFLITSRSFFFIWHGGFRVAFDIFDIRYLVIHFHIYSACVSLPVVYWTFSKQTSFRQNYWS